MGQATDGGGHQDGVTGEAGVLEQKDSAGEALAGGTANSHSLDQPYQERGTVLGKADKSEKAERETVGGATDKKTILADDASMEDVTMDTRARWMTKARMERQRRLSRRALRQRSQRRSQTPSAN